MFLKTFASTLSCVSLVMMLASSPAGAAKSEDTQINTLVEQAKSKADHEKIAALYEQEAKAEEAKAESLKGQAEAYKEHKHGLYGKDMADLQEHTQALSQRYEDSAKRHKALAEIHHRIAAELKQ